MTSRALTPVRLEAQLNPLYPVREIPNFVSILAARRRRTAKGWLKTFHPKQAAPTLATAHGRRQPPLFRFALPLGGRPLLSSAVCSGVQQVNFRFGFIEIVGRLPPPPGPYPRSTNGVRRGRRSNQSNRCTPNCPRPCRALFGGEKFHFFSNNAARKKTRPGETRRHHRRRPIWPRPPDRGI